MTEQPDSPRDVTPETPPGVAPAPAAVALAAVPAADSHELGANAAKAYVPPTALVARKAPVMEQQKVKIAAGVDPRQAKTAPAMAAAPSPRPPAGDGVLPFVKPAGPVQPPPAAAPALSVDPHDAPAAPALAPGPVLPFAAVAAPAPAPAETASPAAAVAAPADPQAVAPAPAASPVAADGSSPWTAEHTFDAKLLPSASLDFLPPAAPDGSADKATSVPPVARAHGMRPSFIVALALAAIVLVAAIVYIATLPSDSGGGPTSVGAGSDSNEHPEEAPASAGASASASSTVRRSAPVKARPPRKSGDPYDGLD